MPVMAKKSSLEMETKTEEVTEETSEPQENCQQLESGYLGESQYISNILEWHPDTLPCALEDCKTDDEYEEEFDETEVANTDVWREEKEALMRKDIKAKKKLKKIKVEKYSDSDSDSDDEFYKVMGIKKEEDTTKSADAANWYKEKEKTTERRTSAPAASTPSEVEKLKVRYSEKLAPLRKKYKNATINPAESRKMSKLNKKMALLDKRMSKINKRSLKDGSHARLQKELNVFKAEQKKAREGNSDVVAVYNKKGNLVYSHFDFSKEISEIESDLTPKHIKVLLEKKMKEKEKIKDFEESGDFKSATKMREAEAWSSAFRKAEGARDTESVKYLKKTIKMKDKKKEKSKKKWAERVEAVEKKKEERQEKRNKNLKKMKDNKLKKKIGKMRTKGHIVPGFW